MKNTRESEDALPDPRFVDPDESNLSARDTGVVQAIMDEGLTVFTFDGLKRLLGLHQEKLSRIIDRLEEEEVLEKVPEGYRVTKKGTMLIARPLGLSQPTIPIVQSLLPRDVDLQDIVSGLKGRWFGSLRWLGYTNNEEGVVLKWIADEEGFQIDAKFTENYLSIDAKIGEGREASQAVKAAHQLLGHISKSYNPPRRRAHIAAAPIVFYPDVEFA